MVSHQNFFEVKFAQNLNETDYAKDIGDMECKLWKMMKFTQEKKRKKRGRTIVIKSASGRGHQSQENALMLQMYDLNLRDSIIVFSSPNQEALRYEKLSLQNLLQTTTHIETWLSNALFCYICFFPHKMKTASISSHQSIHSRYTPYSLYLLSIISIWI